MSTARNIFRQAERSTTTPGIAAARARRPSRPASSPPAHTLASARASRPSRPSASPSTAPRPTSGGGGTTTTSGGGVGGTSSATRTTTSSGGGGTSRSQREADKARRRARQAAEERRQQQLQALRDSIGALPLDPSLVASFAERQREVSSALQAAEVMREQQRAQGELEFERFLRQLEQQTGQAVGGLRDEASARNLAFQPHFVGRGMRDIRDQASEARTSAQDQQAQFMTGLDRMVEQAQQQRVAEMAAIARDRARAQADHRGFIQAQLAGLDF